MGIICRTNPQYIVYEQYIGYPDFFFPVPENNSVIWLTAQTISFILQQRTYYSKVLHSNMLLSAAQIWTSTKQNKLFANYLSVLRM